MRQRNFWLAGLLVVVGAGITLGNVPPTMEDQYVTTVEDTPVMVELRAQDEDIDPNDPGAHPLRFVLLEGPSNGVLIGDLAEVWYEGPYDAVVQVTYVPAAGFVGTDLVTIAVYDPFDETASGTVTLQIDVTQRRAEGLLSGNWSMNATWVPQSGPFTAFGTQLTEVYRVGALTMKGTASVRKAVVGAVEQIVFDSLRFDGDIKLGTLSLASTLAFDPKAPDPADLFDFWRTTVGFALQGVSFRHTFYLAKPVTSSYQTLYTQASVGGVRFSNMLRFDVNDACVFEFARDDAMVAWSWCDLDLMATLSVTCEGFQQARFNLSGFPISQYLAGLTLNAGLTFTEDAKQLAMSLEWRPLTMACIRLYSELEVGGVREMEIDGFTIYGLRMECDIGGVHVVSATSLDPLRNSSVTGQTDYWEVLRASGTLMGCCGVPGSWGIATYFSGGSNQLFDWGMLKGAFGLALTDNVSTRFDLVYRSGELGDPMVELSFGWVVRW
jgi:hypothetical protein